MEWKKTGIAILSMSMALLFGGCSSEGHVTAYTAEPYDKGRLTSIIDYEGTEKSASSVAFHTVEFGYNNDNKATYVKVTDTTTETKSSFDYTLEYDDQGRLVKINAMLNGAIGSYTVLTYREDGLLGSAATYGVTDTGNNILTYYEFTYE